MVRGTALLPGKFYHIYNRGNNREDLFKEERNYSYFLKLCARHVSPIADTYAYCLLRNHFHMLIRVKTDAELVGRQKLRQDHQQFATRAFQSLFTAYAQAVNKATARTGRLFQEHFGRIEVDSERYFANLIVYIHRNPQRHGFVRDYRDWKWSSYHALAANEAAAQWTEDVFGWFGGRMGFEQAHRGVADEDLIAPLIPEDMA